MAACNVAASDLKSFVQYTSVSLYLTASIEAILGRQPVWAGRACLPSACDALYALGCSVVVMLLLALTAMAESNDAKDACGADDVMCVAPGPLIGCLHGRGALCILPAAADTAIRLADAVVVSRSSCNDAPEASADGAADGESRSATLST